MLVGDKPKAATLPERVNFMQYWRVYVAVILVCWAIVVFGYGHWAGVLAHWPMSIVMILGSLVAGSTPMGGGTVAFPILVLLFHQPAANARNFALVIQAVGMTSALLFILGRRVPLPFRVLAGSTAGAAIGFAAGTFLISPHVSGNLVKLLFSCLWMSFGLLTLSKNLEICGLKGKGPADPSTAGWVGFAAGLIGGTMASMIGVGVEMAVYTSMVLLFRTDLKIAIPTAVSAAALASIEGALLHAYLGDIESETIYNWLAATPIVIFGAPIGTYLVSILPRPKVLYFVSFLCVLQFVWTLYQTAHSAMEWWFVGGAMVVAVAVLFTLYRTGKSRAIEPAA
ncbi:MAG: sulfite exporter TauE/SafE family protein [Bryobacteraceae bacterium]